MKIQLTIKLRKKNFIWAKLKILFEPNAGDRRSEDLRTVAVIDVEDTIIYVYETNHHTSKWHADILHNIPQR